MRMEPQPVRNPDFPISENEPHESAVYVRVTPKKNYLIIFFICLIIVSDLIMLIWLFFQTQQHPEIISFISKTSPAITQSVTTPSPTPIIVNQIIQDGIADLGLQILSKSTSDNFVFSPYNLSIFLTGFSQLNNGQNDSDIRLTLKLPADYPLASDSIKLQSELLKTDKSLNPKLAASLWITNNITLSKDQISLFDKNYHFFIKQSSDNRSQRVYLFNNWISQQTGGQLYNVLNSVSSESTLSAILVNHIPLTWSRGFNSRLTSLRDFLVKPDTSIKTNFMRLEDENINSYEGNDVQVATLPLGEGKRLFASFILPKNSIDDYLSSIGATQLLTILDKAKPKPGVLFIPKVSFVTIQTLDRDLKSIGLSSIFNKPFTDNIDDIPVLLNSIYSISDLTISEPGIEEADTSIITSAKPNEDKSQFYMDINKPFLVIIEDIQTQQILLMAKVKKPE